MVDCDLGRGWKNAQRQPSTTFRLLGYDNFTQSQGANMVSTAEERSETFQTCPAVRLGRAPFDHRDAHDQKGDDDMTDILEDFRVKTEALLLGLRRNEVALFTAAWDAPLFRLLAKGSTGCARPGFVEHMAWKLGRPLWLIGGLQRRYEPALTLNSGRYLLDADGTRWQDGPLTFAARHGAIMLSGMKWSSAADNHRRHPPADRMHRPRICLWEKKGELLARA